MRTKNNKFFTIRTPAGDRQVGVGNRTFIVAEMSGNHNQSYEKALAIIDAAAEAGADAVKLQTYTPDSITIDCDNEYFRVKGTAAWSGKTLYELYKEAYTSWDWQPKLKAYGEQKGLIVFSTPFDTTAVDFLEQINVVLYKVASFEVVDFPLLRRIGQTKKPVIMSRGMASIDEITFAIKTLKRYGTPHVAVLHCISAYPAKPEESNLATIPDLARRFHVTVGLSDHTLGTAVAITAVALGASIIEKHLTLVRADGGPDAGFSLEPQEFRELVAQIRITERTIGVPQYGPGASETENVAFRKSLFVVKDLKKGEQITPDNVRSIRPGHGLLPCYYDKVMGRRANQNVVKGTPLSWDVLE